MSPFFPGNNIQEMALMVVIANFFHSINWFSTINTGILSIKIYFIWNVIGILGFFIFKGKKIPNMKNILMWIELLGSFVILYFSKYISHPYDYLLSGLIIIYFSRKYILNFFFFLKKKFNIKKENES